MNKGGQFLLISALIIAGALFSLTTIINTAESSTRNDAFYDLSREVDYETNRVLDYGVFYPGTDINQTLIGFFQNYSDYIREDKVFFIVGDRDSENLMGYYFEKSNVGSIVVSTGGPGFSLDINQNIAYSVDVVKNNDLVTVTIDEISYELKLNKGQNFFFVIIKGENGEQFVATG